MKRTIIALVIAVSLGLFVGATPPEQSERTITLPPSFENTSEGVAAFKRLREVLSFIGSDYLKKLTDKEIADLMLRGLMTADPHSIFLTPEESSEAQTQMRGSFGGIGIEVSKSDDPNLPGIMVVSPIDDTPGKEAGLQAKDLIIKVNGISTMNMTLKEIVNLIRGPVGDTVTLTIYRRGTAEPFDVAIVRAIVRIQFAKSELKLGGIGYIKLTQFGTSVCSKMRDAITALVKENGKPLSGLVLDLQNNPGGLLTQAICVSNQFLDARRYTSSEQAVVLSVEERGQRKASADVITLRGLATLGGPFSVNDILDGKPVLVLINGGSASASELVSGILMTHGRAVVAGIEKSFGKGSIQTMIPLSDGSHIKLTTGQYMVGPSGCELAVQNVGITPDIMLKRTDKDPKEVATITERSLPHALDTARIENQNCRFHFVVPPEHKAAAYKMLPLVGREPVTAPTP